MINTEKLNIVKWPHPALKEKAEPITEITEEIGMIAARMIELCTRQNGLGLAANQIGIPIQMFVGPAPMQMATPHGGLFVFINPAIVWASSDIRSGKEGCLSIPGVEGIVNRPHEVEISYINLQGMQRQDKDSGLSARVWQHEIDHLNGINIVDSMLKKDRKRNRGMVAMLERQSISAQDIYDTDPHRP